MEWDKIIIFGITAILAACVVFLFYIDRKFPKAEKKPDPLVKALLITMGLMLFAYIGVFFDVFDNKWVKEHYWIFFLMFAMLAAFYLYVASKKKPLPPDKLYKEATKYVDEFFGGMPIIDDGHYWDIEGIATFMDNSKEIDTLGHLNTTLHLPRRVKGGQIYDFYVTLDRYTADLMKLIFRPSVHLKDRLMHDEPKSAPDYFVDSLDVEPQ